ncbi:hypothetical protein Tco_0763274 [Tanacetum coccineum]
METIHVTFDEMHQSMAPVRMSSGPEPFIMTPGQLKSGLAPTDKELEMLFQPMFDEYLEQSRVNEPVPSATEVNAQVVPPGTSFTTSIEIAEGTHSRRFPNLSHDRNPNQVNFSRSSHKMDKESSGQNHRWQSSRPRSTSKTVSIRCFVFAVSIRNCLKSYPKNFKMDVIEDCWFIHAR